MSSHIFFFSSRRRHTRFDCDWSSDVSSSDLLTLLDSPWNYEEIANDVALFAQDQWTRGRLTLNLGVRYNDTNASTPQQTLPAGKYVPERSFDAVKNVPHYRNLSPRDGLAYDLFGPGRTAVKGSLGHY